MALQKCKECGNEISSQASSCPKCGAPVKKSTKKPSGCLVLIIVLIAFIIYAKSGKNNNYEATDTTQNVTQEQPAAHEKELPAESEKSPAPAQVRKNWTSGAVKDEMTDADLPYAASVSLNGADFKFPYYVAGGSKATIVIRKDVKRKVAYVMVEKGHMICGYNDCHIVIRDEAGTIKNWSASEAAAGIHNALFINDVKAFENLIKKNKKIRIGIEFYEYGVKSFDFDISGYPGV